MIPTSERQASALARLVPGGATGDALPAVAMPMHMGLDGLLTPLADQSLIAKTFLPGTLPPFTYKDARTAALRAGKMGLSPALAGADAETETLLFDRLGPEWRMASVRDLLEPDTQAAVVGALKQWHGSAPLEQAIAPLDLFNHYRDRALARTMPVLPATLRISLPVLGEWVTRIGVALASAGSDHVPLHGEILASNIMLGPDGTLCLLDFDRAGMGDPFRDLAALALETCTDDEDRAALISLYTGQPATASELARLKLLGMMEDATWALWAFLGETEASRRGPELYKYATNRLIRFRLGLSGNLSGFDMARLLREV